MTNRVPKVSKSKAKAMSKEKKKQQIKALREENEKLRQQLSDICVEVEELRASFDDFISDRQNEVLGVKDEIVGEAENIITIIEEKLDAKYDNVTKDSITVSSRFQTLLSTLDSIADEVSNFGEKTFLADA